MDFGSMLGGVKDAFAKPQDAKDGQAAKPAGAGRTAAGGLFGGMQSLGQTMQGVPQAAPAAAPAGAPPAHGGGGLLSLFKKSNKPDATPNSATPVMGGGNEDSGMI